MSSNIHLFAYFTGKGQGGMQLAASEDGLNWTAIDDKPFIRPEAGLMRDPFLLKGPDDTYHLLWTTDWQSTDIGYASSRDLVNWSPQRRLPVMRNIPGTRNCWAPEMVYDEETEEFLIFWASTVTGMFNETKGSSEDDYNHRMWCVTTPDFKRFSEPSVYFDPGFNCIDVTLVRKSPSEVALIGKDERLQPVRKNLFACYSSSIYGPWSPPTASFTNSWVEGPSCLTLGEYTYVYFDQYTDKRYGAVRTSDFGAWEDLSERVSFPEGARHGSIVTAPRSVVDRLKQPRSS